MYSHCKGCLILPLISALLSSNKIFLFYAKALQFFTDKIKGSTRKKNCKLNVSCQFRSTKVEINYWIALCFKIWCLVENFLFSMLAWIFRPLLIWYIYHVKHEEFLYSYEFFVSLPYNDHCDLTGHAFEARIYAENVPKGFLPATGVLHHYRPVPVSPTGANRNKIIMLLMYGEYESLFHCWWLVFPPTFCWFSFKILMSQSFLKNVLSNQVSCIATVALFDIQKQWGWNSPCVLVMVWVYYHFWLNGFSLFQCVFIDLF